MSLRVYFLEHSAIDVTNIRIRRTDLAVLFNSAFTCASAVFDHVSDQNEGYEIDTREGSSRKMNASEPVRCWKTPLPPRAGKRGSLLAIAFFARGPMIRRCADEFGSVLIREDGVSDPTDAMHKLARSQTDPLFFHDHFLATGHDVNTKNATATYVQFEGRVYAVTCRHVLDILERRIENKHSRFPTLALVIDRTVLNLSFFTAEGLKYGIAAPEAGPGEDPLDLAIADITGSYWELLKTRKGNAVIDLDNWREPRWARAEILVAAGYPDEHKQHVTADGEEKLAAPMPLVCAAVDGKIATDQREVRMRSRLKKPHGVHFSGMSGGPIYVQQDELLVPVGILYEGWPATSNNPVTFDDTGTKVLFDNCDIIVHGLALTPDNFAKWIKAAALKKS